MRCLKLALKFAASAVPFATVVFVSCGPASAHARHSSHRYAYRHVDVHDVRHAGRHLYAIYANDFASGASFSSLAFSSQYFASPYAGQGNFSGNGYGQYGAADNASAMAASQAGAAGLPASLVERVIRRESGGNARAVHAGNYGLMQIRLSTARAMGYSGSAAGLLDPQTNMTYALRYLAGAYRAAGGNESRAVALYSRGYYNQAKVQGFSPYASGATSMGSSFGTYGAPFQPAFQMAAWPAEQYGPRPRRHSHV